MMSEERTTEEKEKLCTLVPLTVLFPAFEQGVTRFHLTLGSTNRAAGRTEDQ